MRPPTRGTFAAVLLTLAAAGPVAADDCPWWRPCGPGNTYTGNRFAPQGRSGVDFRSACQRHDECYAEARCSREACDREFLNSMLALCDAAGNPRGSRRRAHVLYLSVRLFGASSYGEPLDE